MSCKRRDRSIVCVTQRSSLQSNHIPFPLCLWSNQQTNHVRETWLYVSRRARTLLNFRHINQSPLALCLQATKRLILLKFVLSGYQISKWKKKKGLMGLQDSYQDRLLLFNFCFFEQLSTQKATFDFKEQFLEIPIRRYNLYASGPWLKVLFI